MPNKAVLLNTIPILEAKGSSEVEAIITTTDELFKFDTKRPNEYDTETKEAYRHCMALKQGLQVLESGRSFNFNLAKSVTSILLGTNVAFRNHSVSLTNPATNTCYYTPPWGGHVLLEKLKNWENFINEPSDLDPLVRLAVAHYQFEAIHPFSDGNGRTGRILNLLFLVKEGILSYPILYLSHYILQNRSQYSSQKDKIREFIAIVHPNDFAKILYMTNRIHRLLNTYRDKKSNSQEVGGHISAAKEFASKCFNELEEAQKGVKSRDFSKNLNVWEPEIEDLLRIMHNVKYRIAVLVKDCEKKDLAFNAQTENVRLREYEEFLNNSTSYTRKDSGLFAVNLYQFFINNYGYPHWLWVAELLNCLFDTDETEASIRQNIKNQLQQSVVFLRHIGLYYLKKKGKKETL